MSIPLSSLEISLTTFGKGIDLEDAPEATIDDIKKAIFDDVALREFISDKSEIIRQDGERKLKDEIKN
jgi:hypothetical protein